MMPVIVFIVLGITEFIMGLSWGMHAIAVPIVIPLAREVMSSLVLPVIFCCFQRQLSSTLHSKLALTPPLPVPEAPRIKPQ